MRTPLLVFIITLVCLLAYGRQPNSIPQQEQRSVDAQELGKALEYFSSGKYHEALLIFEKLDGKYRLNPRYIAYIGVCHYYEWNYEKAISYLDKAIPQLDNFSPYERSFYYWADAESYFLLDRFVEAIPLYETMLTLCHENEKPDAYYRLGFCYMFSDEWQEALSYFQQSLDYYLQYRNTPDMHSRITQITHMVEGCKKKVGVETDSIQIDSIRTDSIQTDSIHADSVLIVGLP